MDAISAKRLATVHPDLARVIKRAEGFLSPGWGIKVVQGTRTLAQQKVNVANGASQTLRSRHLPSKDGKARAVDLAVLLNGKLRWDGGLYYRLNDAVEKAARLEKVPVEWGGSWRTLKDYGHFQLPWKEYP